MQPKGDHVGQAEVGAITSVSSKLKSRFTLRVKKRLSALPPRWNYKLRSSANAKAVIIAAKHYALTTKDEEEIDFTTPKGKCKEILKDEGLIGVVS